MFDLLSEHKLLIRQRRKNVVTTDSKHWMKKYSDLVYNKLTPHASCDYLTPNAANLQSSVEN